MDRARGAAGQLGQEDNRYQEQACCGSVPREGHFVQGLAPPHICVPCFLSCACMLVQVRLGQLTAVQGQGLAGRSAVCPALEPCSQPGKTAACLIKVFSL